MHKYWLYVYDAEDKQIAPAMVIYADTAARQAEEMLEAAESGGRALSDVITEYG